MKPLAVTQDEWEQEVGTLLRRGMPYLEPGVSSYLAGVLAHPEKAPSTHEQLKIQHALAWGSRITDGDEREHRTGLKLREKTVHLAKVGEGCLVMTVFYRPLLAMLPVIPLGEASYRGTAMLAATAEDVYHLNSQHSPEVYLTIGNNFRYLASAIANWVRDRFKPQPAFMPLGKNDLRCYPD